MNLDPALLEIIARRGEGSVREAHARLACQALREALRLRTDTPYSNLMTAYLALGRFDEAAETAGDVGSTLRNGLQSAVRDVRQALMESKGKISA